MRWTLAALCVLVITGCGHSSATLSASAAKNLVLHEADLGPGYVSFASAPTSSLDVQGTNRSDLARFGRKGGWVERLKRSSPPGLVVSTVDVFRDHKGASADLSAYGDGLARQRSDALAIRMSAPGIGDGPTIAAELVAPGGQKEYSVAWTFRNASASVTAIGPQSLHLADVVALARKQQAKLVRN